MYDLTVIDQFMEAVINQGQIYKVLLITQFAMVFVESWTPFVLKVFPVVPEEGHLYAYH